MKIKSIVLHKRLTSWLLVILSIGIFSIVNSSPINCANSDARWTLLVSQSLIETGTVQLDSYADIEDGYTIKKGHKRGYGVEEKDGHYYNFFPLGSSISSLPFVWVETQLLSKHMKNIKHNSMVHKSVAAFVAVAIFILLYLISNLYFKSYWSVVIASSFWLGSSLSSTLGEGLWSHTFAVLYALLSLYFMLKIVLDDKDRYWMPLALSLFMAYLTRPTMSLFCVMVILYLFFNLKRVVAIKTSLMVFLLLGIFVLFSLYEFDQLLPSYYLPKRLSSDSFWTALLANTLSPSRGIFIFSPFLLLFFLSFKDSYMMFKENKTLLIIVGLIVVHLVIISKFPHWSGGWCFGSRFMSDVLPPIYILYVILLSRIYTQGGELKKILVTVFLLITIPISIYINTVQGLYNEYSAGEWNRFPHKSGRYYFDWKYPQFLHSELKQKERILDYQIREIKPITKDATLIFNDKNIAFFGWSYPEITARWSSEKKANIFFKLQEIESLSGLLRLRVGTLDLQEIRVTINGNYIGSQSINSWLVAPLNSWDADLIFKFDPKILNSKEVNVIEFDLPNARKLGDVDDRELAIALKTLGIE